MRTLRRFASVRFNFLWSHSPNLGHILPIVFLLLFSFSTFTVAYAQHENDHPQFDGFDQQFPPQQCSSFAFTWSGGAPPYIFTIRETNYTLFRAPFGDNGVENRSFTWNPVDVQGGTELFAEVEDSGGQRAFTHNFTIGSSSDGGCLGLESSPSSTASSTLSSDGASTALSIPTTPLSSVPTPADSSTSLPSSTKSAERLSASTIAGIAVGIFILVAFAAGVLLYLGCKRSGRRTGLQLFGRTQDNSLSSKSTQLLTPFRATTKALQVTANVPCCNEPCIREDHSPTNASLVAHAHSVDSHAPGCAEMLQSIGRSSNGPIPSEKLFCELGQTASPWTAPGVVHNLRHDTIEEPVLFAHCIECVRGQGGRREIDGGIRLAGGRAGEAMVDDLDQGSVSDGSTLPPLYSSHYGES